MLPVDYDYIPTSITDMTATETTNSTAAAQAFKHLSEALTIKGRAAQLEVAAHIRAVTGKHYASIANYHNDDTVTDADKVAMYKHCIMAVAAPGGREKFPLQGSVATGDKRVEEPTASTPITPAPPRKIKPATTPVTIEAIEVREPAPAPDTDPLFEMLAKRLGSHIKSTSVDSEAVQTIADKIVGDRLTEWEEGLHDKIKKAVSNGSFPTDRATELFNELSKKLAHRFEFVASDGTLKPLTGIVHPQVTQLATWLKAGVPVWAWSAAGSGKTHMARQVAELLEVPPYVMSVDPTLTVSKIMGYRNVANGGFIPGFAFLPYKDGGLLAMDEIDTGDPGVIASSNALLSNDHYLFPNNETIARHEKFYCLALANTKGTGAVAGYTARNKLDAATLDRFAVIEIKYDLGMEMALACGESKADRPWQPCAPANQATQKAYVDWVQKVRANVGESVLVSPRASINGCKALRAGVPMQEVVDALVLKLCTADTRTRITGSCGLPQAV